VEGAIAAIKNGYSGGEREGKSTTNASELEWIDEKLYIYRTLG
jgi:hypothetical protein